MEFLEQPQIKSTYDKCKYKVKYWEHHFKKKHGRLPSKLDIREADRDILLAYKTYFNLKSQALEESFRDIDGFNSDEDTPNVSDTSSITPNISNTSLITTSANASGELNISNETSNENVAKLKTADVTNTKDTWGAHLNNLTESKVDGKVERVNVNSSFSQKLFKNTNFSKRNPRKSLSFQHRKSESNMGSTKSLSQPEHSLPQSSLVTHSLSQSSLAQSNTANTNFVGKENDDFNLSLNLLKTNSLKITRAFEPVQTKSLNAAQSMLDGNFSSRNLDKGWVDRMTLASGNRLEPRQFNESNLAVSQKLYSQNAQSGYESEDIIEDSDEEVQSLHIPKKRKTDINNAINVNQKLDFSNIFNKSGVNTDNTKTDEDTAMVKSNVNVVSVTVAKTAEVVIDNKTNEIEAPIKAGTGRKPANKVSKSKKESNLGKEAPKRKSTRQRKKIIELEEDSEPEDPFSNPNEDDPEFNPETEDEPAAYNFDETKEPKIEKPVSKTKTPRTRKSPRTRKTPRAAQKAPRAPRKSPKVGKAKEEESKNEEEDENVEYVLEYSVKPRLVTVPRHTNLTKVIKKSTKIEAKKDDAAEDKGNVAGSVKTKREQELDKLKKKMLTGNLNENFVRVDLKKKVYARGKTKFNFTKYKKNMWKQKKKALAGPDMDMGGCDGGMLTCFNCGQIGHFAQHCKAMKGDKLLPHAKEDDEYCPHPTLEEASQMAQESNLAIRKPKRDLNKENDEDANLENNEDEGDDDIFSDDDDDELLAETLKLEEYVKKIDMQEYVDNTNTVRPYYDLKEDGSLIDTPEEVLETLQMFGHSSFRSGQEKAVMRILSGQSTLVTLSTGSGKSLCYQIPAYLFAKREPCITLVISPLVSLMEDQVTGIPSFLKAACLHTNKTKIQRDKILEAISTGSLDVLLVSPEAVVAGEKSTGFGSLLRKLPPVAFACIDEAHCVSQWSHNFRPSYLMICRILKERLGIHTILGLTATATRATCDSIVSHLSIPDGIDGIISDTPLPDNLRLTISKDGNRDQALLSLLLSERFENLKSIIIYCTRRQECERVAAFLRTSLRSERPTESGSKKRKKLNLQAEPYHAGLAASRRRTIQKNFMSGELRVVVATVAFGMGINKSDIRAVIHYNLPSNFESYVQEVGRAGRDGLPAHCHLFLDPLGKDENELQRHVYSDSIDRHVIRKLLQLIFIPCSCKLKCPKHEVAFPIEQTIRLLDIPEENISTLLCYLELHDERYIEVLSPAYTTCKIIAYGSSNFIRKAAKDCPPLAMALAMFGEKDDQKNTFEFPIVEVASAMGWDSGICKFKLKNLEWTTENGQPKRSFLSVQFINLGFRLLAPGNLTDSQLDEALDNLNQRVVDQERTALLQLHALHNTVTAAASRSYRTCITAEVSENEQKLKDCIREYFSSPKPLSMIDIKEKITDEERIVNDVRAIIHMYKDDKFTGRAIARIFYGIMSPNYPAVIWGRCKFWRSHLGSDFSTICRIATREILKMR